jgi:hypothetical protein
MPNIESIPDDICLYNALDPYHVDFDNKPLRNILARQKMINAAVDNNTAILASAQGSTGSLANRLIASLQDSGNLWPAAVDLCMHKIDAHTDSDYYVRMTTDERAKLLNMADGATNIQLSFETAGPSNTPIDFPTTGSGGTGAVAFADSVTTSWRWESDTLYLDVTAAPASHVHFYDQEPYNYLDNFTTYSLPPFADITSVRVYINGSRVSQTSGYHPVANSTGISSWTLNSVFIDTINNCFVLTNPITQHDVITVDYDRPLS